MIGLFSVPYDKTHSIALGGEEKQVKISFQNESRSALCNKIKITAFSQTGEQ